MTTSETAKKRIVELKAEKAQIEDTQQRNTAKLEVIEAQIKALEPLVDAEPLNEK